MNTGFTAKNDSERGYASCEKGSCQTICDSQWLNFS